MPHAVNLNGNVREFAHVLGLNYTSVPSIREKDLIAGSNCAIGEPICQLVDLGVFPDVSRGEIQKCTFSDFCFGLFARNVMDSHLLVRGFGGFL
ncbi:hypothetical protein D3C86_1422430 [compost metagenome]